MEAPSWIQKRVSSNELIESFVEGRMEIYDNEDYDSQSFAAIVGTTSGIYFIAKTFISKGFSHYNTWESFLKKAYVYSDIGLFKSQIIINLKSTKIIITTKKSQANHFLAYYSNKKTQGTDNTNITHFTSSSDIVESIKSLKSLFDDGLITKEEFELKKTRLLKRL